MRSFSIVFTPDHPEESYFGLKGDDRAITSPPQRYKIELFRKDEVVLTLNAVSADSKQAIFSLNPKIFNELIDSANAWVEHENRSGKCER